jgi:murein DD-endopeptidase MepM/ murein hydrolase activator NlpD
MRLLRKYAFWVFLFCLVTALVSAPSPDTMRTRLADGFDQPVGKPDAEGYYISRGFRARYHMGEDWNGLEGGNSDLGKPVYATASGVVVLARNMRMSWGNLVIIRHIFLEERQIKTVDSVYAHLDKIFVIEGKQIVRGQQIGTIGTNRGMYVAHLHFEIRKNLSIGYNQRAFPKDLSSYYIPGAFIAQHRKLHGAGRSALVAVNTFNLDGKGLPTDALARSDSERGQAISSSSSSSSLPSSASPSLTPPKKKEQFRVNRFSDPSWNQ